MMSQARAKASRSVAEPLESSNGNLFDRAENIAFDGPTNLVVTDRLCTGNTDSNFSDYDVKSETLGVLKGIIMFPRKNGVRINAPLVIFVHGKPGAPNGTPPPLYQFGYSYLLRAIAQCGFIAISIECSGDQINRAAILLEHVKLIVPKIKAQFNVTISPIHDSLYLVGHSQGGEAVSIAAEDIKLGAAAPFFYAVRSVISLAPTFAFPQATSFSLCQFPSRDSWCS